MSATVYCKCVAGWQGQQALSLAESEEVISDALPLLDLQDVIGQQTGKRRWKLPVGNIICYCLARQVRKKHVSQSVGGYFAGNE